MPGATFEYPCQLHVGKPGPFEVEFQVHVFDPDLRAIKLGVHGVGVAGEGR